MNEIILTIGLGILGAALGSFAGAQVWRLRARQLVFDKQAGQDVDAKEYKRLKRLTGKKLKDDRSECLSCQHTLAWYDLVPIVSWVSLVGRCRYCKKFIGWSEILLEVVMAGLFAISFLLWPGSLTDPLEVVKLVVWLTALVTLAINFIYDAKWSLLVSSLNWLFILCGAIYAVVTLYQAPDMTAAVWSLVGALAILSGLYAALWLFSRGKWVGDGDIYLGAGIALFLGDWRLAFVSLFVANLIGTLYVLPALFSRKLGRGSQVPFGPFLIIGGIVTWVSSLVFDFGTFWQFLLFS